MTDEKSHFKRDKNTFFILKYKFFVILSLSYNKACCQSEHVENLCRYFDFAMHAQHDKGSRCFGYAQHDMGMRCFGYAQHDKDLSIYK